MIEARELTKRYGQTLAVDRLSCTVLPGRVTGFLGPNGAGKSTTMRMILGLDSPTSGQVLVDGGPYVSLQRPLHEVGALLDANAVHGGRTAFDHLLVHCPQQRHRARAACGEVLSIAGIDQVAGQRVGGFSLGMKQRLGIAVALLGDPAVLIFDEPINGLDPDGIRWIRALARVAGRRGPDGSGLQSPDERDGDNRRPRDRHRPRQAHRRCQRRRIRAVQLARRRPGPISRAPPTSIALLTGREAIVITEPDGGLAVSGMDAPGSQRARGR